MQDQVRIITLERPETITRDNLRKWSNNFSLPTVVRNAFDIPSCTCESFLRPNDVVFASKGNIAHFQAGNGKYPWGQLWDDMNNGYKVYGSFGVGTENFGHTFSRTILDWKSKLLPADMFAKNEYSGHLIFGACDELQTSSPWHNAVDANLLFQLHGEKHWYTMEQLPEGFQPLPVTTHANTVINEKAEENVACLDKNIEYYKTAHDTKLFESGTKIVLRPGDMLINPPFSWHAIKIDQFSISLSLRGDREDVCYWIGQKYFNGQLNNPLFLTFSYLFNAYSYVDIMKGDLPWYKTLSISIYKTLFPNYIIDFYNRETQRLKKVQKHICECKFLYELKCSEK